MTRIPSSPRALDAALAMVKELGTHGYAIVPIDPTPEMCAAGSAAGAADAHFAARIYSAMIGAAAAS